MAVNKRLLQGAAAAGGLVPSEHFGVVLYEGDGSSSHSINGGKFGAGAYMSSPSSNAQYIALPNGIINGATGNISVSFWMNTTYSTAQMYILTTDITPYYSKIAINTETNGKLRLSYGNASNAENNFYTTSTNLLNGNWHHIVYTLDIANTTAKIYVNGSLETTHTTTITPALVASPTLTIGNMYRSDTSAYQTNSYKGKLDQFRFFHNILSSSQVSTLYAETAATVESLDPLSEDTTDTLQVLGDSSCVATYRFENDEVDLSGNYNGTGNAIQYAAGRYGQAASFNNSSYINVASGSKPDLSTCTVSFWIKTNETANTGIIGEGYSSNHWGDLQCNILGSTGVLQVRYGNASTTDGSSVTSTSAINTGVWVNCAVSISDSELKIYINGSLETTHTPTVTRAATTNPFTIGALYGDGSLLAGWYLNGEIDQVRIFNKVLSASEVTTLYNENSLVASYRFEGNANDDMRAYDGTATNVTYEYGLGFTPDFVWMKQRTYVDNHYVMDSTRGAAYRLHSNLDAQSNGPDTNRFTSFDTGGFTLGNDASVNQSGQDYVAWCLKANGGTTSSNTDGSVTSTVQANQEAGFSIVKYTGAGGVDTIGHGLSSAPEMIIVKSLGHSANWYTYHIGLDASSPEDYNVRLDQTDARQDSLTYWNDTAPTETVFTLGTTTGVSQIGTDFIAYCFHSVENFSKFGSYTGNGSTNGPIVETGFEPAFIMFRQTDDAANWCIVDNKRSTTNPRNKTLRANSSASEATVGSTQLVVDFLSNGFQLKQSGGNNVNNGNFIYMAFAADPDTEAPTVAKSFSTVAYTGNGGTQSLDGFGFTPSMIWTKGRTVAYDHGLYDSVRGGGSLIYPSLSQAASTVTNGIQSFDADGVTFGANNKSNASDSTYVAWAWKADDNEPTINTEGSIDSLVSANANAGFSIVKYTGNNTAGATVGHGLSAVPQMIIVKRLESPNDNWAVYNETIGNTKRLALDESGAAASNRLEWNSTTPSATTITLGNHSAVNTNSSYIAYCFHSVSNYSKIGSYSGTGSAGNAQSIGFQPDFILGKSYDNTEDWFIVDSPRGGNKYLKPNLSNAEATAGSSITFTSTGFEFTGGSFNNSGMNFIYMAFKIN